MLFCGDLTILLLGLAFHCFVIENRKSLCHSLGRPSRSDFVQFEFTYKDKESGEEDKKDPNPGTSGDSEQQGTSDTSHKKESVKTGDTTAIAVPVAGIVGVAVLLYVMRKRRKIES